MGPTSKQAMEERDNNAALKLVQVNVGTPERMPGDERWRATGPRVTFERAWQIMLDCGRDDLHVPRHLSWSVLPRSREYMNMESPFSLLCERYFAAAVFSDSESEGSEDDDWEEQEQEQEQEEEEEEEEEETCVPDCAVPWWSGRERAG